MRPSTQSRTGHGTHPWKITAGRNDKKNHPCLWMQAGAVTKKYCTNFFDCSTCRYNAAMEKRVDEGKQISWQDCMRLMGGGHRACRHALTGRVKSKSCPYNYQCSHCSFDQMFEDFYAPRSARTPRTLHSVKGFDVPEGYYFHNGHTWALIQDGGTIRIGFDDFSLKVLGQADALDLPPMGKELNAGRPGWGLKRQNHQADVLSPVSGVILEVNQSVRKAPALASQAPYEDGWLFSVHTNDVKESLTPLMTDETGMEWISDEVSALESMIEDVAGPLAADGGYLRADVFGSLPSLGWDNLTKRFLRS